MPHPDCVFGGFVIPELRGLGKDVDGFLPRLEKLCGPFLNEMFKLLAVASVIDLEMSAAQGVAILITNSLAWRGFGDIAVGAHMQRFDGRFPVVDSGEP